MAVRVEAKPVDRLIASFRWIDWFEAKLLEKHDGIYIDVHFSQEISVLTRTSKVSVRVSKEISLSRFSMFLLSLRSLISVLKSAKR
jgi:hypothetical protein